MVGHVGMPHVPVASPFRRLSSGAGNGTRPRTVTCQPFADVRGKAAVVQRPPRPALADRLTPAPQATARVRAVPAFTDRLLLHG